jgi:hypothetical protein
MAGDTEAAMAHYRRAADRSTSLPERRYLTARAARLKAHGKATLVARRSVDRDEQVRRQE